MIDFRKLIDYRLKGSVYGTSLQPTPQEQASQQKILRALDDMADLWTRINADTTTPNFTPPLLFSDGFAVAAFEADLAALRAQFKAVVDAENDARMSRRQRDALLDPLRSRFVSYRVGIEVEYGALHAFTTSLPDVSPSPGSTPDAVTLSGQWNSSPGSGLLTWNESTSPNLDHYLVRFSPGATYDSGNSSVSANLPPGTTVHETLDGLASPGDTASFKVFVVLTTGNQAGSNTTTITRP